MTAEEMERAIGFLLESQAKHDAQLSELRDQVSETNRIVQMHAETQSQFIEIVSHTLEALGASQRRTDERLGEANGRIDALVEAATRTDERLDALVKAGTRTDERINALVEAGARADERNARRSDEIDARLDRMVEAGARADERLAEIAARADARMAEAEARDSRRYDELDARLDRLVGVVERLAEARG
ncbi:MAG TPA: hypothetical protein VF538_17740 [Pyrinomonadaceae bacterium]|jgi:chromosome segregation ATPase